MCFYFNLKKLIFSLLFQKILIILFEAKLCKNLIFTRNYFLKIFTINNIIQYKIFKHALYK